MTYLLELSLLAFIGFGAVLIHVIESHRREERERALNQFTIFSTQRFAEKLKQSRHHPNSPGKG